MQRRHQGLPPPLAERRDDAPLRPLPFWQRPLQRLLPALCERYGAHPAVRRRQARDETFPLERSEVAGQRGAVEGQRVREPGQRHLAADGQGSEQAELRATYAAIGHRVVEKRGDLPRRAPQVVCGAFPRGAPAQLERRVSHRDGCICTQPQPVKPECCYALQSACGRCHRKKWTRHGCLGSAPAARLDRFPVMAWTPLQCFEGPAHSSGRALSVGRARVVLRSTRKLLRRLRQKPIEDAPSSSTLLGDWCANVLWVYRKPLILAVSARTVFA